MHWWEGVINISHAAAAAVLHISYKFIYESSARETDDFSSSALAENPLWNRQTNLSNECFQFINFGWFILLRIFVGIILDLFLTILLSVFTSGTDFLGSVIVRASKMWLSAKWNLAPSLVFQRLMSTIMQVPKFTKNTNSYSYLYICFVIYIFQHNELLGFCKS